MKPRCSTATFQRPSPAMSTFSPTGARSTRSPCCGTSAIRFVTIGSCVRWRIPRSGSSDASLAMLCGEPPDPQRPLFELDDEPAPTVRASRWNPRRDLRLGWNVIRGEQDDALSDDAAARLAAFSRARASDGFRRWTSAVRRVSRASVWREGLAREGEPGSARAPPSRSHCGVSWSASNEFVLERSGATLADVLEYARATNRERSGNVRIR